MSKQSAHQKKYLEELNKYKDTIIQIGVYNVKIDNRIASQVEVVSIIDGMVQLHNIKNGLRYQKTEHWVRKKIAKQQFTPV